jgi:glycosyltransferase involved in cell wall biosynthesis
LKVALVEFAGKGGLIHYAYQLCSAMQAAGAEVTLITDRNYELDALPHSFEVRPLLRLWDPKPASDSPHAIVRRIRRAGRAARYYREWERAARELRALRPDVVQLGDIRFATDLAAMYRVGRTAPVLADICHNVHPFSGGEGSTGSFHLSSLQRRFYSRIYRHFDAVFVHYETNQREFERVFPQSASRVHRIVHGNERIFDQLADPEVTVAGLRRRLGLQESAKVVLFFGTLSRYKGLDLLLRSFRSVAERVPDAHLVLAGFPFSDFDPEDFLAQAAIFGLAGRVTLVPQYIDSREVRAWIGMGEAVVFPYRSVFQSGALHLACTFGSPIVATRVGANEELIRDGENGLLIPPDDETALADALTRLLEDEALARRLGETVARDAETYLSWDGVAGTILGTYESLIERREK